MLSGLADDIPAPMAPSADGIAVGAVSVGDLSEGQDVVDIFAERRRKAWGGAAADPDKEVPRADITSYRIHYAQKTSRMGFLSHWKKSLVGPALADLKASDDMVPVFADASAGMIRKVLGDALSPSSWAVVTAPRRRHKDRNFATLVASEIAARLGLPFFEDCAVATGRARVGAVFLPANVPPLPNVIVYDDIVTTGSTLTSMKNLLEPLGKTTLFFASIDNSL